jgi:hypothetical protein
VIHKEPATKNYDQETLFRYWRSLTGPEKLDYSRRCKLSMHIMGRMANGHKGPDIHQALTLERESGGAVNKRQYMPLIDWDKVESIIKNMEAA